MAEYGKEIKRVYDEFGPIQVFDDGAKRVLMFGENDEQGCVLKQSPTLIQYDYVRAMLLALVFEQDIKHCLVLGLGSGALAHCLLQQLPLTKTHVVELRRQVIKLAYSHFQLPRDSRLKLTCEDGGAFISRSLPVSYDLIFSDIYHSHGMDKQQGEISYIQNCMRHLSANGWLVLNYWVDHQQDESITYIKENFAQVWVNNVHNNNWIIMASQSEQLLSTKEFKSKILTLATSLGFSLRNVVTGLKQVV
jgi:spermidine synthase